MKQLMRTLALPLLVLAAGPALAHNPMCECEETAGGQVTCTGGFSDGSGAPGVTLDVIGYDEQSAGRRQAWRRLDAHLQAPGRRVLRAVRCRPRARG